MQRWCVISPKAHARRNPGTHRRGAWASWLSKNFWNKHLCPFSCSFLPSTPCLAWSQKRDQVNPIMNILKLHKFSNSLGSWVVFITSLSLQGRVYVNLFFHEKADAPRRWQISKSSSVDIWGEWRPGSWWNRREGGETVHLRLRLEPLCQDLNPAKTHPTEITHLVSGPNKAQVFDVSLQKEFSERQSDR